MMKCTWPDARSRAMPSGSRSSTPVLVELVALVVLVASIGVELEDVLLLLLLVVPVLAKDSQIRAVRRVAPIIIQKSLGRHSRCLHVQVVFVVLVVVPLRVCLSVRSV